MSDVRPLQRSEVKIAGDTLADAFQRDPFFSFLLPPSGRRHATMRWFHRRVLDACITAGGAFTLEDGGPEAGAIGIVPPGKWPLSIWQVLISLDLPATIPTWRFIAAGLAVDAELHTKHPAEPHTYVYVLGVAPGRKRQGLGARLMARALEIARETDSILHLETSNPENLHFYRRFGLDVVEELTETRGGPPIWVMQRPRSS